MITNDDELREVAVEASTLLQEIQDYCGREKNDAARVNFPRGFLQTAAVHRRKLPRIPNQTLRSNISYAMMTLELFRWVLLRTDLSGQAKDMLIKEAICVIGSICESLTLRPGTAGLGRKQSFVKRTARLVNLGIITNGQKDDLDWVWDIRCREHLASIGRVEYDHYLVAHYNRAMQAYLRLRNGLKDHYG